MGLRRYRKPNGSWTLTPDEWRALHREGLTAGEAMARTGKTRAGVCRAADRLGFKWRRVMPLYDVPDLSGLTDAQRETYRIARAHKYLAADALRIAQGEKT